ncbi:hypothetical protein PsorP6_013923 [Peronosclerospora sorghi]|uniref:Uncharacterized protein n=1 Tax=Peronosclerospora sorghi TaxID=230839 RepID=A0ACC0VH90_9STRA|nr:hypothetical protein PsorP6_013923 [Peronosclerospora sorghi]
MTAPIMLDEETEEELLNFPEALLQRMQRNRKRQYWVHRRSLPDSENSWELEKYKLKNFSICFFLLLRTHKLTN